jgi:hypothetical protein
MRSIPPALVAGFFFIAGRRPAGMLAARSVALEKPSMSMPFSMTPTLPEAHSGRGTGIPIPSEAATFQI